MYTLPKLYKPSLNPSQVRLHEAADILQELRQRAPLRSRTALGLHIADASCSRRQTFQEQSHDETAQTLVCMAAII